MNAIAKMLPAISTPEAVVPTTQPLHEAVRAAVVLTALEPDVAANVLSGFSDARIRSFARAMTRIGDMQATEINAILHDFMNRLKADGGIAGGEDEARRYLSAFMEPDSIEQMMEEIAAPPRSVWSRLGDVPDATLSEWLAQEHPQVAAVTLTQISSEKSARLLETFDPTLSQQIVLRMGQAPSASPEIIKQIAEVVERDVLPQTAAAASKVNPANVIATVLNQVSGRVRDELISHMKATSAGLADDVRRLMFTFEDIPMRVEARDIALVLKSVDDTKLMTALKPESAEPIATFFLENITKRMAERLREEIKELAEPDVTSAEAAQSAVIATIIELKDNDAIVLKPPVDDAP
ncbi:MAG: FliG C-terminal domain-containing protein [Pikeienuella sp.]